MLILRRERNILVHRVKKAGKAWHLTCIFENCLHETEVTVTNKLKEGTGRERRVANS